jgi:hypothetical protein
MEHAIHEITGFLPKLLAPLGDPYAIDRKKDSLEGVAILLQSAKMPHPSDVLPAGRFAIAGASPR